MARADDLAARRLGTSLNGKYRLEQLLGEGGMGAVYRATHRNGNRVAVKLLHPALALDSELRGRFLREGYVANKVDHRGAVRVLDDDVAEDGAVFLVMELLEGETLSHRAQRAGGRLPWPEVVEHALALLTVLAAAHAKGIVHRDVKPDNLFVTTEGKLKVLDFGIARLLSASDPRSATTTRTGHLLGTPAFMPPEQVLAQASEIDGQTDLWSAGATMFWLLSGQYVHPAETAPAMLVSAGSRPARSVTSAAPATPPAIAAVIDRALAFRKDQRWRTAMDMHGALADALRVTCGGALESGARDRRGPSAGAAGSSGVAAGASSGRTALAASMTAIEPAAARTRSRRAVWLGASLSLALALAGAAGMLLLKGARGSGDARAPQPPPALRPAQTEADPPRVELIPPVWADAAAPPVASAPPLSSFPRVTPAPRPSAPGAARPPALRPTSVRPVLPPDCDPPYTISAMGLRIPRPECL